MLGKTLWAIPEGYIPGRSHGQGRELESHEAFCVLNAGDRDAAIEVMVFFTDREPAGPYRLSVPARRTRHFRFNDLDSPEPIPRDTPLPACSARMFPPSPAYLPRLPAG